MKKILLKVAGNHLAVLNVLCFLVLLIIAFFIFILGVQFKWLSKGNNCLILFIALIFVSFMITETTRIFLEDEKVGDEIGE